MIIMRRPFVKESGSVNLQPCAGAGAAYRDSHRAEGNFAVLWLSVESETAWGHSRATNYVILGICNYGIRSVSLQQKLAVGGNLVRWSLIVSLTKLRPGEYRCRQEQDGASSYTHHQSAPILWPNFSHLDEISLLNRHRALGFRVANSAPA
jgi:hypothetical protein